MEEQANPFTAQERDRYYRAQVTTQVRRALATTTTRLRKIPVSTGCDPQSNRTTLEAYER